jgi:hypothetical protein
MSFESIEPSMALEDSEGDITSGADYLSQQHVLIEPSDIEENVQEYAARAAERLVGDPVESAPAREPSAAERAYDRLQDAIDTARDQGVDDEIIRNRLDPNREIENAYKAEERAKEYAKQDAINRSGAEAIRQSLHDANMGAAEEIADPAARKRAIEELLARERAKEARRGLRA